MNLKLTTFNTVITPTPPPPPACLPDGKLFAMRRKSVSGSETTWSDKADATALTRTNGPACAGRRRRGRNGKHTATPVSGGPAIGVGNNAARLPKSLPPLPPSYSARV